MFERLKPKTLAGQVGLVTLIMGAVIFVALEITMTIWLDRMQVIGLLFWLIGLIGGIVYIIDLVKQRNQ
ncbi:hypothetical protein ABID56_001388 [Alkalibacillus flavidus]|uniref:Uncharacterized protein n=1 Tax=Alkalibacillus flavidus TaxID=546021 RepID=A0ABV2KUN6_9BACI